MGLTQCLDLVFGMAQVCRLGFQGIAGLLGLLLQLGLVSLRIGTFQKPQLMLLEC